MTTAYFSWRRLWLFLTCATFVDCWATIPGGSRPRGGSSSTPLPTIEESSSSAPSSSASSASKWPKRPSTWKTNDNQDNDSNDNNNNRQNQQQTIVLEDHFVTPERDPRSYRLIRLSNNLIALLVSDGMTEGVGIEAASVHVKAGHFDDTVPGLARTFYLLV
jgi:insulysin